MNTHVIEEKAYCFTENEFSILLSAAGISRIICFDLENGKKQFSELGKRECNEAILSLVQSGVLAHPAGKDEFFFEAAEPYASGKTG